LYSTSPIELDSDTCRSSVVVTLTTLIASLKGVRTKSNLYY